jgi:small subunit ribosomal protein S3
MGQKINPVGFRLAVNRNWSSKWYANSKSFAPMLAEDIKVRDFLKRKLAHASVGRVLIERPAKDARITIFSARPGVVIGKKGEEIESLKAELRRIMGVQQVHVNIEEIRKPEIDAQLIADSIAQQLEKRIMFRRAMKRAMQNAMRLGAQGIKIMSAGRLNGIEIARTEWYREGRVPLHTLRADIDYGMGEAKTNYGVIGIKVWVYKGEVIPKGETALLPAPATAPVAQPEAPAEPKRAKKPFPKAGAKRGPAKPRADGEKKAARKPDAAPAPKTVVKKAKKIVKDEGDKSEGEKKEEKGN